MGGFTTSSNDRHAPQRPSDGGAPDDMRQLLVRLVAERVVQPGRDLLREREDRLWCARPSEQKHCRQFSSNACCWRWRTDRFGVSGPLRGTSRSPNHHAPTYACMTRALRTFENVRVSSPRRIRSVISAPKKSGPSGRAVKRPCTCSSITRWRPANTARWYGPSGAVGVRSSRSAVPCAASGTRTTTMTCGAGKAVSELDLERDRAVLNGTAGRRAVCDVMGQRPRVMGALRISRGRFKVGRSAWRRFEEGVSCREHRT